jgi:arginine-tRNA-protein transferase
MTEYPGKSIPALYLTAPAPCPYLPGQRERKVFTHLLGNNAVPLNDALSENGFRRSQTIAYRPACEGCTACVSVRIRASDFAPSRNFRRVISQNGDLVRTKTSGKATQEQFSLLRSYLDARHDEGGMADMTALDYVSMVEDTTVRTEVIEYRIESLDESPGALVAVALTDVLADGLSMVYTFFDVSRAARSLGTYLILDHIREAQARRLPYVYLGYWIAGCRKMSYKARFQPLEALGRHGWQPFDELKRS